VESGAHPKAAFGRTEEEPAIKAGKETQALGTTSWSVPACRRTIAAGVKLFYGQVQSSNRHNSAASGAIVAPYSATLSS